MENKVHTLILREKLQSYFNSIYPYAKIATEHTIEGQIHIRFDLGGKHKNGTVKRIKQATDRAVTLFKDTFPNQNNEIWVLIYEYSEPNFYNATNEYLHQQFPSELFDKFYNQLEQADEDERQKRVIIGKLPVKDIEIKNILNAIANTEMGFEPKIDQRVYFINPLTDKAFQMYDDRGCFIWSDNADKIRNIYEERNKWIVDYHRPEIDGYFAKNIPTQ
jgi:Domain of unknown function (DUF3885)